MVMMFEEDSIRYKIFPLDVDLVPYNEAVAISDAEGRLQFMTNGNVVVSWDGYIMEGGKGFNEGSGYSDFNIPGAGDTTSNVPYIPYTYQLILDGYEAGVYYMLHSFLGTANIEPCAIGMASTKMQLSKIDMRLNGGKGKVVYKNRYINEVVMGAAFVLVQHGNGRDWWLVQCSPDGLHFRATLLRRDSVVLVVESQLSELSSAWFTCGDLISSALNLLEVSSDGSLLVDNFGTGYAKLMDFDRCSGVVTLRDTFSLWGTYIEHNDGSGYARPYIFAFSPSGRYLYGVGFAGFDQYDLWAADIRASWVHLEGIPRELDDFQNAWVGQPGGYGPFSLGPDGKLYSLNYTAHNVIVYPDEWGEASGLCVAARAQGDAGYGVSVLPTVGREWVEVPITLPRYRVEVVAEMQVVDALGRVVARHCFAPYAYLHRLDVSGWSARLYHVVLAENGRPRATARLVVCR